MTSDDTSDDRDIRHALFDLAAHAPVSDPRAQLPSTLARRRNRRLTSLAAVAVVALAATGVASLNRSTNPANDRLIAAEGETPAPVGSETPTTEPSPSASGSPSALASESASAAASVVPVSPTAAPSPAASSAEPVEEPSAEGLQASMDGPTKLSTAQYGVYPVRASDPQHWVWLDYVSWGDGDAWRAHVVNPYSSSRCSAPPAPKRHELVNNAWDHAWRHPGTYVVEASVSTWRCDVDRPLATRKVRITVVVAAGAIQSNGPKQPDLDVRVTASESSRPTARVWGGAKDLDGHLTGVDIDWGDGQSSTMPPTEDCHDGGGRYYPHFTMLNIQGDGSASAPPGSGAGHYYSAPGTYTVVVRASSRGCDGGSEQQLAQSFTITVPASGS